jgi:hypothetical protein
MISPAVKKLLVAEKYPVTMDQKVKVHENKEEF